MGQRAPIATRLTRIDWSRVEAELDDLGWSRLPPLLTAHECDRLVRAYDRDELYRSTIDMERYRFGRGQYRYFANPLPPIVAALRRVLYQRLAPLANEWAVRLRRQVIYPASLEGFVKECHAAGQTRPTPLILHYGPGDYNCLHQDIYGAIGFPLQVLVMLSQHGRDYDGGEVVLVEQRPRAQSKATAILPAQGEALIFTNRDRPVHGTRGDYAVQMRHGASLLTRGQRFVLGIIFHDAA
jgi:uncharacterized protein